jgi:ribonuclease HII
MKESTIEKESLQHSEYLLCIDEAGRGPLAGPVTVAGVLINSDILHNISKLQYLDDSKKVSYKKRNILQDQIKNMVISYELCDISEKMIDDINIYEAKMELLMFVKIF